MDCIVCGKQVVNEKNRLQNKVKDFLKPQSALDVKHQWIQQWKICYDCSEKYTNNMLVNSSEVREKIEQQKNKKRQEKAISHKWGEEPPQAFRAHYIQKYIDYATYKAERKVEIASKRPHINNRHKYDTAYIAYLERSESTALLIVRDIVDNIDTKDKWIDVRIIEKRFLSHYDRDFSFIIVELFPRKQKPTYPKKMAEETDSDYKNRITYITWQTATSDINHQRSKGIKGDVYIVLPCLKNEHEDKYDKHYIAWDNAHSHFKRVRKSKHYVDILMPPKWGYDIVAAKKIKHQHLHYIEKNLNQIIGKIHKKRAVTLSIFSLPKKK